jgi:exodeoxyribonuclease-3
MRDHFDARAFSSARAFLFEHRRVLCRVAAERRRGHMSCMRLRICTWNVNSVRLRHEQVARFVREAAPDVICLQEIKCQEGEFPREAFAEMGLPHLKIAGQKGWHGVAIASALPLDDAPPLQVCREGHARCVGATVAGVEIHNFYIPAGGDTPDRLENRKFDHKLDFYEKLTAELAKRDPKAPLAIVGDLNVAPGEHDVWNHKYMSKVVSHTPIELEAFAALKASLDFIDLPRAQTPEPEKMFSWWSYRAQDFRQSNRGLRLDHILVTPGLKDAAFRMGSAASRVHDTVREWERPSDHAPVTADLVL